MEIDQYQQKSENKIIKEPFQSKIGPMTQKVVDMGQTSKSGHRLDLGGLKQ